MKTENKNKNVIIILAFFVGAIVMYLLTYYMPLTESSVVNKLEKEVTINENGIADAVEKVYDAVVVVESYNNDVLYSSGTGFVYKINADKAYILTNNHVIDNCNKVTVTFTNGEIVETTIEGKDSYSDIAVLSVNKDKSISVVEIGSSTDSRVGDTVFSVGAPLDSTYSWTVTRGIVSGKDRLVSVASSNNQEQYIMKVLQTDTAINSGNSGGPLANGKGEVIGITSLKLTSTGVEGMGFAIPIEYALNNAEKLETGKTIVRPYLGISMYDSTYKQFSDVSKEGVTIYSVEEGSSADKASMKSGDIIISVDGNSVQTVSELKYELYLHDIGETVNIKLIRDGKEKSIELKLKAKTDA